MDGVILIAVSLAVFCGLLVLFLGFGLLVELVYPWASRIVRYQRPKHSLNRERLKR